MARDEGTMNKKQAHAQGERRGKTAHTDTTHNTVPIITMCTGVRFIATQAAGNDVACRRRSAALLEGRMPHYAAVNLGP